ncbi:MAG: hypothetical protein OXG49_18825 [Chloroflexi bacterium]|nr:hypothetical protein [Chloroflexota bacterium]
MDPQSVFHEEWLRSLREQYKHVVRNDDRVTLESLSDVMSRVGFRESELTQLRIEATMHVDEVGADFSADLQILSERKAAQAHPAECMCPDCVAVDESRFDADGQPLAPDPERHHDEQTRVFPSADIAAVDLEEAPEPVTFEDSVAADALQTEDAASVPADDGDEGESDPDAPEQMSLF